MQSIFFQHMFLLANLPNAARVLLYIDVTTKLVHKLLSYYPPTYVFLGNLPNEARVVSQAAKYCKS